MSNSETFMSNNDRALDVPVSGEQPLSLATYDDVLNHVNRRRVRFMSLFYIRQGWGLVTENKMTVAGAFILWILILVGANVLIEIISTDIGGIVGVIYYIVAEGIFLYAPFSASWFYVFANAIRNNTKTLKFKDFFYGFSSPTFFNVGGSVFLSAFFFVLLLLLLIIPGIWYLFASAFVLPFLIDNPHLGPYASIRMSVKTINKYFCRFFGFFLLNFLLQLLGIITIFGWLLTIPISCAAGVFCYHHLVGLNGVIPPPTE